MIQQVAESPVSLQPMAKDVLTHARMCDYMKSTLHPHRANATQRGFALRREACYHRMGWSRGTEWSFHHVFVCSNFTQSPCDWGAESKPAGCQEQEVWFGGSSTQERSATTAPALLLQDLFHVHHVCSICHSRSSP
jgi:hypothetical protein